MGAAYAPITLYPDAKPPRRCIDCGERKPATLQHFVGAYGRICRPCTAARSYARRFPGREAEQGKQVELLPGLLVTLVQLRILSLTLHEGLAPAEIAARLHIEPRTVEDGLRALRPIICARLGLTDQPGSYAWLGHLGFLVGKLRGRQL